MTAVRRVELRDGQLVRLFASFADDVDRPDVLPRPRRMGTAGRAAVAIACSVASLAAILGIVSLWIATTPGWWFCALFTAFLGGLAAALWLAYGLAIRSAGRERTAAAHWADSRSRVTASRGRIIQRHVGLGETATSASST